MHSWAQRALSWAGSLFGDEHEAPAGGAATELPPQVATLLTETGLSEALCHGGAPAPGRPAAAVARGAVPSNAFGHPLSERAADDERGAVAMTSGMTAAGIRATAFVSLDGAASARDHLTHAARRRLPLLVHAHAGADHDGYHALADAGVALAMARDAQHAVDLCLLGRRLAEEALLPVVVTWDGRGDDASVVLPDHDMIARYVGAPDDAVESAAPAQARVFEGARRRVPRWFDPDRPVAQGAGIRGATWDAALAGKSAFFDAHAAAALDTAAAALERETGREVGPLFRHKTADAGHVLVGQGAVIGLAAEAADNLRAAGQAVGVLGISWLRPLFSEALAAALAEAKTITVLERGAAPVGAQGALWRECAAALRGRDVKLLSARYGLGGQLPAVAELEKVFANSAATSPLYLGVQAPDAAQASPRRQVLLQEAARLAPGLAAASVGMAAAGPPSTAPAPKLPLAVRRLAGDGAGYEAVARFWGESYQPAGGAVEATAEPYLGIDALPSATATFRDRSPGRAQIPRIEPSACTGCGRCWTACPDAAIGPVAASTAAVLDAAADRAGHDPADAAAGKLKRAHKQLASRIDGQIAKGGERRLTAELVTDAGAWLAEKMNLGDDERPAFDGALQRTIATLSELVPAATEGLFHLPHGARKGDGALLMLAVSPQSCQGCGLCAAACGDDAIEMVAQTEPGLAALQAGWAAWEAHPDTAGALIGRAAALPEGSKLAATLLARSCLLAVTGGDDAEAGSGARLATRLVAAVAEYAGQQRVGAQMEALSRLGGDLKQAAQTALAGSVSDADLADLAEALAGASSRSARGADVLARLDELGGGGRIDGPKTNRLVRSALAMEQLAWSLAKGAQGTGRARHGVVLAGAEIADWALRFPHNPFTVPVVAERGEAAADHALGLALGLALAHTAEIRRWRRASLALADPADLPAQERAVAQLRWTDLDDDERSWCPPVLLLGDATALMEGALPGLRRVLASDLPVKVVLLDGRNLPLAGADAALLGLAGRDAYVAASSVADFDHLFDSVSGAMAHRGPALLHVHAPAPTKHGFAPDQTLERARLAVAARVHPLLRYDPAAAGVFGSRLDLSGNPEPAEDHAIEDGQPLTLAMWAAGEARFAHTSLALATAERAGNWTTLRELAGLRTPFTAQVRAEVHAEVAAAHAAELAALKADHEAQLRALSEASAAEQAAQLKARLLQLVGNAGGGQSS